MQTAVVAEQRFFNCLNQEARLLFDRFGNVTNGGVQPHCWSFPIGYQKAGDSFFKLRGHTNPTEHHPQRQVPVFSWKAVFTCLSDITRQSP
jgi:hypothetical protein